jgi:adenylate cyclase
VAQSGRAINIPDAYTDDRFNPDVDRQTGYRTRCILCLPIKNRDGDVFAVAQLLNRRDGQPFDVRDEARFTSFIDSIGVIFETLESLSQTHAGGAT